MSDASGQIRSIAWREAVPFVRLFAALSRSLAFGPMALAFAAVASLTLAGWALDGIWRMAGAGVQPGEIASYTGVGTFDAWRGFSAHDAARLELEASALLSRIEQAINDDSSLTATPDEPPVLGPFSATVQYMSHAAWNSASPTSPSSLCAGLCAAGGGGLWLISQRPWFAVIFGVIALSVLGFFGGAISRCVAVRSARDESLPIREALKFACEKFPALLSAPLALLIALGGIGLLVTAGSALVGLVAAIPVVGGLFNIIAGLGFVLVLLAALFMMLLAVLALFGYPLMTPTIATEGSDAFDAIQRAAGYLFPRAWMVAGYALFLLIYGMISWLVIRAMAMVVLKFAHCASSAGLSLFGKLTNASDPELRKFDAIWAMPAWAELPWTPGAAIPFWGAFAIAPLQTSEMVLSWLVMFWVSIVVGVVVAFGVSFFFAGAQEMYFLLRRNVDSVDYDEIYYEEGVEDEATGDIEYKPDNPAS